MPWELIDFIGWILWIAVIITHFVFTVLLVDKSKVFENMKFRENYLFGIGGFFFIHGICRIPYFVYDYYIHEEIWWLIGAVIGFISIVWLMYFVETSIITKTRHVFTIIGIIGAILIITVAAIVDIPTAKNVQYVFISPLALIIPIFYLYAAIKSTGEVRRNSLIVVVSAIVFEIAEVAHTDLLAEMFPPSIYLAPIMMIAGLIGFYFGSIRNMA